MESIIKEDQSQEFTDYEKNLLHKLNLLSIDSKLILDELDEIVYLDKSSIIEAHKKYKEFLMWTQRAIEYPDKPGRHH